MSQKRIWQLKKGDPQLTEALAAALGISRVMAAVLVNRGFSTPEEVRRFITATLAELQNPRQLPSMSEGVARISQAINKGESILVYGDYDVDGITGTVLLTDLLRRLGGKVHYYIPDRLDEGYGLNKPAILQAKNEGIDLLVTVDCGIASVAEAACAAEQGIDLVITDHHQPPSQLPQALAVINPKLAAIGEPWRDLAGVGVAFKVGQAVALEFAQENLCEEYLDLVALGTIADIVPLQGENRILVKEGLARINLGHCRAGLKALIDAAGLQIGTISAGRVSYVLAPRLNACGRLGKADLAVKLLLGTDLKEMQEICQVLERENSLRREMEEAIFNEAVGMLEEAGNPETHKLILLASAHWHPGVIGIVASRLTERYYRPTILLNIAEGIAKGSGRSIHGFDLYQALAQVKGDLLTFGGHGMAAGLALAEEKIPLVKQALQEYAAAVLDERSFTPVLQIDAEIALQEINEDLVREMELLNPCGYGNPMPVLATRSNRLEGLREVGQAKNHLKVTVLDQHKAVDGIGFQLGSRKEEAAAWEKCDLAFIPEVNSFNGVTRLQLVLKDLKNYLEADDPYTPLSFLEQLYVDGEMWLEDNCYRDIPNKEEFYTKVVGVTFEARQEEIRTIPEGEAVELKREQANVFDSKAVGVYYNHKLIGYLNTHLARNLAPALERGVKYQAYVTQITGRDKDKLGVNICVQKVMEPQTQPDAEQIRAKLALCSVDEIERKVKEVILGQAPYHEKQQEALAALKEGLNTLVIFGTGRGKSAVFQTRAACLALLEKKITILVYPLRALVNDQYHRLQDKMSTLGVRVAAINGSKNMHEKKTFFKDFSRGRVDIVLTTPEFLAFHLDKFQVAAERLGLFVVDEAHHLAENKRQGYRRLRQSWQALGQPLSLAVTATADDLTAEHIAATLGSVKIVVEKHVRKNLVLVDSRWEKDKLQYLLKLLDTGEKIVIYVNSRVQAYQLAADLRLYYPAAREEIGFYHGGLNSEDRGRLEKMYREGSLRVMVTTSAFGEGIDIPDIKHVVLYHLCFSLTEFNQLAGRAGRNNEEAKIHLLFNEKDKKLNELILERSAPTRKVLGQFYLYLRQQEAKEGNPLQLTNRELREGMLKQGIKTFSEQTASACLAILEELGLLLREVEGKKRYLHLVPPPPGKLDLADSVRFLEGRDEWEDFQVFAEYIFTQGKEAILAAVNRPIFPAKGSP